MMKTLAAGWLIGAGILVWSAVATAPLSVAAEPKPLPVPVPIQTAGEPRRAPEVIIPVRGITAEDLRDTFTEARGGNRIHRAMDILAPLGTPVVAAVDGTIRKLFLSRAGGITVYQYDTAQETVYYYAHLDRYADGLAEGMFVKQGTVIGYVGTTGNAGATPHLHFSIERLPPTKEWWKGDPVNPYPILRAVR